MNRLRQTYWLLAYDLRSLRRDRGLLALLAVALGLALWGLLQGAAFEAGAASAVQAAQTRESQARSDAQRLSARYFAAPDAPEFAGAKWWASPFDIRGYAFYEHVGFAAKPALPGAALAVAQADVLPPVVRVRADSLEASRSAYELEHPARLAVGRFDLMFCIVYLWPLLLLALNLPVLNLEREKRQLPVLRLQGVSPAQLLLARTVMRSGLAALVLAACVALAAGFSGAVPSDAAGLAALGRWALWLLAWSLFWAGVAAAVAAVSASRATAAFSGFAAWVVLVVLLPTLLGAAVGLAAPQPSRESYVQAMRDAGDQFAQRRSEVLARFYDDHPAWRPAKTALDKLSSSVTRIPRMLEQERLMAPVEARFANARAQREALFSQWLWLSPASLVSEGLARAAGHDADRHRRFEDELKAHHAELRSFFHRRIQEAALRDEASGCKQTCVDGWGFQVFEAVPRFQPSPALQQATPLSAAALWAWVLALLGAVAWRLGERRASVLAPASV
jgi:ABC-2 type transport system permease protein